MSESWAIQTLCKQQIGTLTSVKAVVDGVAPEKTPSPWVVIGNDVGRDIGTKSNWEEQFSARLTVHSKKSGFKEVKAIAAEIKNLLHEKKFTVAPYEIYAVRFSGEAYDEDQTGLTRRGDLDYTFWVSN